MRAALYHRVSTGKQEPANARETLKDHARRLGADVELDIEETGSGARNDRPGLQQVMTAARHSKIDIVIVWALDRFGRSTLDLLANIQSLTRMGVRFVAVTQGLDVRPDGDAMSEFVLTVLAGVAQFERSMIRERTRVGMARAKRQGKHCGRKPTLELDPERAKALRDKGLSWSQLAKELGCSVRSARRAVNGG